MDTNRHAWVTGLLAACLLLAGAPAHAATPVPKGKWSFIFFDAKGHANRPVRVYTYRPVACDTTCPIQFVLHGAKRDAGYYRDYWELLADRYGLLLVTPEFTQKEWPRAAAYNLGGVGESANPERWTYSLIEHLFDEMRDGQESYNLFGHGAGAQFVQRMTLLLPEARWSVAMVANPGWFLMPEWRSDKTDLRYPYSAVGSKAGEAQVRAALAKRVVVVVGARDEEIDDENLEQAGDVKKQGADRIERAENFIKMATTLSRSLGMPVAWELIEVPDTVATAAAYSKAAANNTLKDR